MRLRLWLFLFWVNLSIGALLSAQDTDSTKNPPAPPPMRQGGDFAVDNPDAEKIPTDVIIIKGAVPSATDGSTPLPEGGVVNEKTYTNQYFGFSYILPLGWHEKYVGPPPSDSGYYVLAQLEPTKALQGAKAGTILIGAQDLFFARSAVRSAQDVVSLRKASLTTSGADYMLEKQPTEVAIAGRVFYRMDYMSPAAELHWYTLTTEIRCHSIEFTLTSRDPALLETLAQTIEKLKPAPASPGMSAPATPVCIRDYATGSNVAHRVAPVLTDRKFNAIPVRLVIDRDGRVKHVHVISAFPDQAKVITDALMQWEFKPLIRNGQPVEVETGLLFGTNPQRGNTGKAGVKVSD